MLKETPFLNSCINYTYIFEGGGRVGTRWRSWLRHCATSWKVAGSIPDGVIGIFHWHNPSSRPGVESVSNRNEYREYFLGGVKAAGL